jgi:hypothetical protein
MIALTTIGIARTPSVLEYTAYRDPAERHPRCEIGDTSWGIVQPYTICRSRRNYGEVLQVRIADPYQLQHRCPHRYRYQLRRQGSGTVDYQALYVANPYLLIYQIRTGRQVDLPYRRTIRCCVARACGVT